jgi:hypothetical protein
MEWDNRLDPLGVNYKPNSSGIWAATQAQYEDENEAQGQHHVWFTVLDENGRPRPGVKVFVDWVGRDVDDPPTQRVTDDEGRANIDIYANLDPQKKNGPYFAYVEAQDRSDVIAGMGLPLKHHVNFRLTFAPRAEVPEPPPPPPPPPPVTVEEGILARARAVPWMPVNNGAALWNFAKAMGLQDQQTDELTAVINGQEYVLQVFNLGIVYARKGDWGNIKVIRK